MIPCFHGLHAARLTSIAVALAALTLVDCQCGDAPGDTRGEVATFVEPVQPPMPGPPPLAKPQPPAPPRVILIGLDGATWAVMDPLITKGRLPTFQRLRDAGAHGPLETIEPSMSPMLWTTIATGMSPERHGVAGFHREEAGKKLPFHSTHRREKAVWEILGNAGFSSNIIYWWITWPAEPINGVMLSDYLFYMRKSRNLRARTKTKDLRAHAVHPIELQPWIDQHLARAKVVPSKLARSFAKFDDKQIGKFLQVDPRLGKAGDGGAMAVLKNKIIEAEFHRTVGLELMKHSYVDLHTYYSKGIDASGHMFWRFFEPDAPLFKRKGNVPNRTQIDRFAEVVPNFYIYEDGNVAQILERAGPNTWVVVVSDHGFRAGGHGNAPDGVVMLSGPGAARGKITGVKIHDITPLLLYLFDVPVAKDMDGRVPEQLFADSWLKKQPIKYVPSYGKRVVDAGDAPQANPEALQDELKALGYIE